jgi:hypothetical protein
MGSLLGEHTKWYSLLGGTHKMVFSSRGTHKMVFSSMGTCWKQKKGSLIWEHTKWVLFHGNRKKGFSSMGTGRMGSLLREQTKRGSPKNVGFCVGGGGRLGGWSAKKRVSWGKKKTLNFTYICDFGVVLSLTCVVGLCVDVLMCVCVCAFVVVAVVVWASSGLFSGTQLQTLFSCSFFFPLLKESLRRGS